MLYVPRVQHATRYRRRSHLYWREHVTSTVDHVTSVVAHGTHIIDIVVTKVSVAMANGAHVATAAYCK